MKTILTTQEVAEAIYVDLDFEPRQLISYAESATSFIFNKTGYHFENEEKIEPMAKTCAILYIRNLHFNSDGIYNKEHDYTLGISQLLIDLQNIARSKS